MSRAAWNAERWRVHTRDNGRCLHCGAGPLYRFCVIRIGARLELLCPADCCRHFAPVRAAKVRARRHRRQLSIQEVP